jgi:hypothetical protein
MSVNIKILRTQAKRPDAIVAGLGRFLKPRNTRKGNLARLRLVSVYSGCSVVPWFSGTRTNPWLPDSDFFKPRNTQNTRKGILARLCLVSVYSGYSVVLWFSGTRTNPWLPDSDFFKPRNTRNTRKGILARLCLVSVYSGCSVVPFCKV